MNVWSSEEFIAGHPALDFLNTVSDIDKSRDQNKIADWESFSGWCANSELFSPTQMARIFETVNRNEQPALLKKILKLREHAYVALSAIIKGDENTQIAMQLLQGELLSAMSRANLSVQQGRTYWQVKPDNSQWIEDALALAIDDLMRSESFLRIRQCGRCTWLFLDKGRGRGRRWCSMNKCGNREKMKRFRSR